MYVCALYACALSANDQCRSPTILWRLPWIGSMGKLQLAVHVRYTDDIWCLSHSYKAKVGFISSLCHWTMYTVTRSSTNSTSVFTCYWNACWCAGTYAEQSTCMQLSHHHTSVDLAWTCMWTKPCRPPAIHPIINDVNQPSWHDAVYHRLYFVMLNIIV